MNAIKNEDMKKEKKQPICERIVSYETGMLLKKCGFDEICDGYYCSDFVHEGRSISLEEELDLKAEGRGGEVSEIKGGALTTHKCRNSWDWVGGDDCAAPRQSLVEEWLRVEHGIYIEIPFGFDEDRMVYGFVVRKPDETYVFSSDSVHLNRHEAVEFAIVFALEHLVALDDDCAGKKPDVRPVPCGTQWVHRKTGGIYTVVSGRSRMKTRDGWEDCVVYAPAGENEFEMFARSVFDFSDKFDMFSGKCCANCKNGVMRVEMDYGSVEVFARCSEPDDDAERLASSCCAGYEPINTGL